MDSKADILLYGNAERAVVALAHGLAAGKSVAEMGDLRGTAIMVSQPPEGWSVVDCSQVEDDQLSAKVPKGDHVVLQLPSYEAVAADPVLYAHASRLSHLESNPGNAHALIQAHGTRHVWINPPPIPLTSKELDDVYELPFARAPHPAYDGQKIPAWEMIRFSVNIMRGCFGGCSFCSITEHEGRIIQSRSEESILREIERIRDKTEGFTGTISDVGGPTANMWRLNCKDPKIEAVCRRLPASILISAST
jgi:uncharacterized radical SAM protein YgiQ